MEDIGLLKINDELEQFVVIEKKQRRLRNSHAFLTYILYRVSQKSRTILICVFIFDLITRKKLKVQERVKFIFMFGRAGTTHQSVAQESNLNGPEREQPLRITIATEC